MTIEKTDQYIGIIGAMKIEVEQLKAILENVSTEVIGTIEFVTGIYNGHKLVVAESGIGKVHAAMCAQTMYLKFEPKMIINIGVAGGDARKVKMGDIVVSTEVIQHDFDTSPAGDPKCLVAGINLIHIPCDKNLADAVLTASKHVNKYDTYLGVIATGDQFMDAKEKVERIADEYKALAFDMESGSIGQVCYINQIPFVAIRAISDTGSESSFDEYSQFLDHAAHTAIDTIKDFLA